MFPSRDREAAVRERRNALNAGGESKLKEMTSTMAETTGSQVALLHRISSIVSSDQDLEAILRELVSLAMNVTHSDACLVYLIDHATNEIVLRASQLPHDAEIGKVRLKMGEGITGWVAVHNSVVALGKNASADCALQALQFAAGRYLRGVSFGAAGQQRRTDRRHQRASLRAASAFVR